MFKRKKPDYVESYRQVCQQAADYDSVFANFRQNPVYTPMLEHVTPEQGMAYAGIIRNIPAVMDGIKEFRRNDEYGNPKCYTYPGLGKFSPTTLRYIKVLADLTALFGALEGRSICEIGVGYGGQCRIIDAYHALRLYHLVDIPPALRLTQRYLDHFVLRTANGIRYKTMNELHPWPPDGDYNLVISNYAYSEFAKDVQDAYFHKIIDFSARGYMTYNHIQPEGMCYTAEEIRERIPGAEIFPEVPLTHAQNCIIVWGHKPRNAEDIRCAG